MNFKRKIQAGLLEPYRSRAYINYVKSLECSCGKPADEAHHVISAGLGGGMGTKPSDLLTFPVCRACHDEIHRDVKAWESTYNSQWMHVCLTLLQAQDDGVINL
jgi:hypothetical protein